MKTSQFLISTLRDTPNDAEIKSHQLMLRAGLIRRVTSGIYSWSPLGLRVLKKTEAIVREEMNNAGALEMLMPSAQPAELWIESGRWEQFGPELLRFKDRHTREYCLGPTHEEVITDFARQELKSYRQLPINFYQIQWKFRDEIRPRFGVMRSREFLMKDAYSFHIDAESLDETYNKMYRAYSNILDRLDLEYRAVFADSGAIGGSKSQEFHVITQAGEDAIVYSTESDYAANVEAAEAIAIGVRGEATSPLKKVETPNVHSIEDLAKFLNSPAEMHLKTLILHGKEDELIAVCLRGDHELNEVKAENSGLFKTPLQFATDEEIAEQLNTTPGSIGPVNLPIRMVFDRQAALMSNFSCGANETGFHYIGVNIGRDLPEPEVLDLREIKVGDPSPCGKGTIAMARGIEVGHIFQLGDRYSKAMNATVLDQNGKATVMQMGCYGIGVTRIVAAAIEQRNDDAGIIWPKAIAPFTLSLIPMNYGKSALVKETTDRLYDELMALGIDVLLEDRNIRPGEAFSDHELIGIPFRIVVGDRTLKNGEVEFKARGDEEATMVPLDQVVEFVKAQILA
ncbi:proline--tRNA ligase [Ignatzschineria cameli]|uniref:Proline--tRNA ligase n=1 Tax=Ignatzschineria cameli TaxID=2182793 RepID=A0A2U2ARA5_9GAMM|nr:proline--tRNA ligase [Ignatzschineria cameli]PWD86430.1 proline--tRNA ligase [Ignatzschineria cameli]PWD89951.1 proline--tRNA ligase [Ignatzschineria cameli]PWD91601.1 proline--tRNA ligase [Ignatzschineria cameli]PWD92638.1 proline--tRNA ligase [Ignatzschineria cameli]